MIRQMHLGAFFHPTGHHIASWRHPDSPKGASLDLDHYIRLARTAERGKFDLIFLADGAALAEDSVLARQTNQYIGIFEPLTLLSALSMVTERIGLVATASTTYNEPLHVARKYASLDHLSHGRAGWNVVTTGNAREALNFGREEHLAHADRYERAREFVEVVTGLWDCWEDDALVEDKAGGTYLDTTKVHPLNHEGPEFSVRGPMNIARSPQGWPVIVQAGSSEAGKELAAATAEIVFTAQQSFEEAKAFYDDLKGRMPKHGRRPEQLAIMPGMSPIIGRTQAEAEEKFARLQALIPPELGVSYLSTMLGSKLDLSRFPIDGPLPDLPETNASKSVQGRLVETARRENLTIRQLYLRIVGARSHWVVLGTAETIADSLERWFIGGAVDGFNVMPSYLPTCLDDFVDQVIPILQRRGLFRTDYEGTTLREHLGYPRPERRVPSARKPP